MVQDPSERRQLSREKANDYGLTAKKWELLNEIEMLTAIRDKAAEGILQAKRKLRRLDKSQYPSRKKVTLAEKA